MKFLNSKRVLDNRDLFTSHVFKARSANCLRTKKEFIGAINTVQRTAFSSEEFVKIEFDNGLITTFLSNNEVFEPEHLLADKHITPKYARKEFEHSINRAISIIQDVNPGLYQLLNSIIGTIAVYSIAERDGGSISNGIGLIWLSPQREWDEEYYGEMLIHELIHNCIFLEDMVRGVMPNTDLLGIEDALSISAIRQTRRPYDKAFHSACVVAGIMYYYFMLGKLEKASEYRASLLTTLDSLQISYERLRAKEQSVLSPNGYEILKELHDFSQAFDYSQIEKSLSFT